MSKAAALDPTLPQFHGLTAGGINRVKSQIGAWAWTPVDHLVDAGPLSGYVPRCWASVGGVGPTHCPLCLEAKRATAEWRALLPIVPNGRKRKFGAALVLAHEGARFRK